MIELKGKNLHYIIYVCVLSSVFDDILIYKRAKRFLKYYSILRNNKTC